MEFWRDTEGQIQADLARRAGLILAQYTAYSQGRERSERFEVTLALVLLQALLANCVELLKSLKRVRGLSDLFARPVVDVPRFLGIRRECIKHAWSAPERLSYQQFLESMRHAMSHPTPQRDGRLPTTGYTTVPSSTKGEDVELVRFTNSPWVGAGGRVMSYDTAEKARKQIGGLGRELDGLELRVQQRTDGKFIVMEGEEVFVPYTQMELTPSDLAAMTAELSNLLAKPLEPSWDGQLTHSSAA